MNRWAAKLIWLSVVVYRGTLGLFMTGHCRFTPTCSQYMLEAVERYGPWRGVLKGMARLARCHPFGGGGYDPP